MASKTSQVLGTQAVTRSSLVLMPFPLLHASVLALVRAVGPCQFLAQICVLFSLPLTPIFPPLLRSSCLSLDLVTGGTGFVGSHTVVELIHAGRDVVIVDDLSNSSEKVIGRIRKITGLYAALATMPSCF